MRLAPARLIFEEAIQAAPDQAPPYLALQNWQRSLELGPDQPKIIDLIEKYSKYPHPPG